MSRKCYFKYETFDKIGVECCNTVFRELDMFCLCTVFSPQTDFITVMNKDKQEAHGPHRSPEKTVQINKHI